MANPEFTLVSGRGGFFIQGVPQFTEELSLISSSQRGFHIKDWRPAIQQAKGGGVFASNPLANGRQLMLKKWDNAIETLTMVISADSQDTVAAMFQTLVDFLEKATGYWLSDAQNDPVYIRARGSTESEFRYAVIYDYRIESIANPFATPFFGCNPSTMDDIVLTIERGMWQDVVPGYGDCVEISATQSTDSPSVIEESPAADADDADFLRPAGTGGTAGTLEFGRTGGTSYFDVGIRFTVIPIAPGTTISRAYLKLYATGINSGTVVVDMYGEDEDEPAAFSNYADFTSRTRTTATASWWMPATIALQEVISPDISHIIQEIIDRPTWELNDDIALLMYTNSSTTNEAARSYSSHDTGDAPEPVLHIEYINEYGQEETCRIRSAHVANKRNAANLTHIYVDNGGVFGSNLLAPGTLFPYLLLPAVPAANDAAYFGSDTSTTNSGPFSSLVFDITTPAADTTIVWEYYSGAGWSTLTASGSATGFFANGVSGVFWEQPYNWTAVAVNGVTAFWVRARVSAVGASPGAPEQSSSDVNRHVYTVTWPSVTIAEDSIYGDLPALIHIEHALPYGATDLAHLGYARVLVGSRAVARGDEFTAYINLSDEQNQDGVSITLGNDTTFINNVQAATGRCASYNSLGADAFEVRVYATIEDPIRYFKGRYRIFLRATAVSTSSSMQGAPIKLTYALDPAGEDLVSSKMLWTVMQATPAGASPTTMNWQLFDFGFVDIPFGRQYYARRESMASFTIKIWSEWDSTNSDIYFHDLILIPCDEWFGDFIVPSTEDVGTHDLFNQSYSMVVDSLTMPRKHIRSVVGIQGFSITEDGLQSSVDMDQIYSVWRAGTQGEAALAPNTEQKLWFLGGYYNTTRNAWTSYPEASLVISMHKAQRWMGLRGRGAPRVLSAEDENLHVFPTF